MTDRDTPLSAQEEQALRRYVVTDPGDAIDTTVPRSHVRRLLATLDAARSASGDLGGALDSAYTERNAVVAALIRATGWRCWVADAPDAPDWYIVYVETPAGQVSWHFPPWDIALFGDAAGAPMFSSRRDGDEWDGHTADEKYARLAALPPASPEPLDVERLARAMHSVHGGGPCYTRFRNCETGAEAIAREYAALAAEPKPEEAS